MEVRGSEEIHITLCPLELARAPGHRKLQAAVDLLLVVMDLKDPNLQPQPGVKLHVDVVVAFLLLSVVGRGDGVAEQEVRALERRVQHGGVLVALVEGGEDVVVEPRSVVQRSGLHVVVVDADPLVRVADAHVHAEVVLQTVVVAGEGELRERGGADVHLDFVGAEDKPDDENDDADDDDDGDDELEEGAEEAAGAAAGAAAHAVVGLRRRDRRAVVGSVQVALLRV